ncbi:MAG: hypothetical protein RLZZ136_1262 [Pseudomonadota bacterium]|jgi:hypothetical protein
MLRICNDVFLIANQAKLFCNHHVFLLVPSGKSAKFKEVSEQKIWRPSREFLG